MTSAVDHDQYSCSTSGRSAHYLPLTYRYPPLPTYCLLLLQLERVLLASSGTLLLTWTDPAGAVDDVRRLCHERFPGASAKQPNIIHTSLFRILTARQLDRDVIEAVHQACGRWTDQVSRPCGLVISD